MQIINDIYLCSKKKQNLISKRNDLVDIHEKILWCKIIITCTDNAHFLFVELVTYFSNLLIQMRLLLCKVNEIN
jgi:hypothetical protein